MKFSPDLRHRTHAQREEISRIRREQGDDDWRFCSGSYPFGLLYDDPVIESAAEHLESRLSGIELFLLDRVDTVVKAKHAVQDASPVVVLDVGGMYGMSLLRLAKQPGMKERIQSGEVAYVVSNLDAQPAGQTPEQIARHVHTTFETNELELLRNKEQFVHYVRGDVQELKRVSIQLPGRARPWSLRGGVDIIHESTALAHSLKPDIDLPHLGKLLSPYGMMCIGSFFSRDKFTSDAEFVPEQIDQGVHNLVDSGLRRVDFGERKSNYIVLTSPRAPEVVV